MALPRFLALIPLVFASKVHAGMPERPDMDLKLANYSIVTRDYCLPSGLRISFQEDHSQPMVAVTSVIDRGSDADPETLDGIAHLVEHLWFRSEQGERGSTWDYVLSLGTDINAFTSADETAYMTIAPRAALQEVLRLEALRITDTVHGVTADMVRTEKEVVRNELRLNTENTEGVAWYYIQEKLFPEGHPYHHTTIGTHATLNNITLEDVQAFTSTNYTPQNTTILVVGDIPLDETWELVLETFPIELLVADPEHPDAPFEATACPVRIQGEAVEPPAPVDQTTTYVKAGVKDRTVLLSWTLPGGYHANTPLMYTTVALLTEAIATYLRMPDEMYDPVDPDRMGCFLNPQELASTATCYIELEPDEDAEKTIKKAVNGLYKLWDIENRDWQKFIFSKYRAFQMAAVLETVEGYSSLFSTRATETALFTHFTSDAAYFSRNIEWLAGIEAHDSAQLAQQYLNRDRYVAVVLEPYDDDDIVLDSSDNQYTGHPREPVVISAWDLTHVDAAFLKEHMHTPDLSEMRTVTLSNGLRVVILPYGSPLIGRAALLFHGGELREPRPGLDQATWEFTDLYEDLPGLNMATAPTYVVGDWDLREGRSQRVLGISGSIGNMDAQLYLLRALVEGMKVDMDNVGPFTAELTTTLRKDRETPEYWLEELRSRQTFPGHPMGRTLDEATIKQIANFTPSEISSWGHQVVRPGNGTLFIIGQTNLDKAEEWARTYFSDWTVPGVGGQPMPPPPAPTTLPERQVIVLDYPRKSQTEIQVSCQLAAATPENDMARLVVGHTIDEMVATALRENSGVTYGANALTYAYPGGTSGMLLVSTVQNDAAGLTVDVFLDTIARASKGELDPALVKLVQLRDTQQYVLDQQTTAQMMDRLMEPVNFGYPWEAITQRPDRLANVVIPDLQEQVQPCVGHEVILVAGPQEMVLPQLDERQMTYRVFDWKAEAERLFKENDPKGWAKEQKRKAKEEKKNK